MLRYRRLSHPQILPPIPGFPPRPANEEQIIAHQWEQHQARGLPDTDDMVSGTVSHADEYLGQEEMSNAKEQLASVLTRRRRRQHAEQEQQ